ncbi:hypothetical protein FACS1894127_5650 [Clostridia bacterium]|nr:hypothetical protein FACS1894127_5650 [Clostridia bacterium]
MAKVIKKLLIVIVCVSLVVTAGCGGNKGDASGDTGTATTGAGVETGAFSRSEGIDANGFWEGITALDYVELFDYNAFVIPKDVDVISDDQVQSEVDAILESYSSSEQITDRAVADGDTVNIDYVGSVDGVEFEGGTTNGAGTEITIGVTSYIDNFLEQLIGHKPGETFDINVTFPEDYGVDNLNGKAAVFVTTVNHIVNKVKSDLTDAFVAENLSSNYGWNTVAEMKDGIKSTLQRSALQSYVSNYLANDVVVKSVPEKLMEYQNNAMIDYYQSSASSYGVELEEFLNTYVGVSSLEQLVESNTEGNTQAAKQSLVIQAIAEDSKMTVKDEDLKKFFVEQTGSEDYAQYETDFGLPYLKQAVLSDSVMHLLMDHSIRE